MLTKKLQSRINRKRRIRARVRGSAMRPRLTVYRSLTNLYAQVIDDDAGKTLVSSSLKDVEGPAHRSAKRGGGKLSVDGAKKLGAMIATKAKEKKIEKVVFDRNAYKYHGRIKALADAAREGGLQF